jgi:hypothetical protein
VKTIPEEARLFIVEELVEGFMHVVCNAHGICLVKLLIKHTQGSGKHLLQ